MRKVLITGVTGFAGSHLVDYLLTRNDCEIHGIQRWRSRTENIEHLKPGQITLHECDLRDATSTFDTIDKITCERLRRVSKAMKAEGVKGDLGFRVFKKDSPALARPLHLAAEQLQKGQAELFKEKLAHVQPADLFTEVLLLLGFPLDTKREQVPQDSANTLWRFEHPRVPQPLLLCLDQKIDDDLLEALKDKKNHLFVCRDEALTDISKARFYDALKLADSTFKVL